MSTEAIALSELIKGLQNLLEEEPPNPRLVIKGLILDVQKRTDPIQYLMDKAYATVYTSFRPEFLRSLPDLQRQAICVGNLNFTVETKGFLGWIKDEMATSKDFSTLEKLGEQILTPVGYTFRSILMGVYHLGYGRGLSELDRTAADLEILTNAYQGIKVQWLVEVANYFRIQIASEGQVSDNAPAPNTDDRV